MLTKLTVLTQKRAFSFRELGPSYVIDRPSQMAWWGTPAMSTPVDVRPLRARKRLNCCLRACNSSPHECFELGNRLRKTGPSTNSKRKAPGAVAAHRGFLVQRQSRIWRIVIV